MRMQEIFEFGPYRLQPGERLLLRNGEPVALTAKVFDLLVVLVENPGSLLERDELIKTLWPDSFIEENNLTVNVSTLRKVLAEGTGPSQYIETVPKRGYRFVADVRRSPPPEVIAPEPPQAVVVSPPDAKFRVRPIYVIAFAGIVAVAVGVVGLLRSGAVDPVLMEAMPLTSYPGSEYSPTISPDGTRVAFTWQPPNGAVPGIYVKVIGAGDAIRLTDAKERITDPSWSPDGTQIAAFRGTAATAEDRELEVVVMPAIGGTIRKVAEVHPRSDFHGGLLNWSPDGKWLLLSSLEQLGAPLSITAVSVETGQKKAITSPPPTYLGDSHPSLSPDGRRLVFSRNVTSIVGDYYLLEVSASDLSPRGQPKRLTFFENQMGGATWLPDGREIVFSAGPPLGGSRLFRLPFNRTAKPGEMKPIPYVGIDGRAPAISRPNRSTPSRLVYEKVSSHYSLWRLDLSDGKPGRAASWAPSTRMDQSPDISPDGKKVAFASTRSGSWEIWACDVSGLNCAQLTNFGRSFSRSPRWSPDGTQIVFDSRIMGNADIFVIGSGGGKPKQLTTEPSNEVFPSWSADGRFIYFSSNRTGESKIWKMPSGGGPASLVSERTGEGPQESRDGKWVYFVKRPPELGIWRVPAVGGAEEQVVPGINFGLSYTVARSGLYYVAAPAESHRFLHYSFLSGKSTELFTHEQLDPNGLSIAPDERWLLYVQSTFDNSDLMFVDNFK